MISPLTAWRFMMATLLPDITGPWRIVLIVAVALLMHLLVLGIRVVNKYISSATSRLSKARTLMSLLASVLTFSAYFLALGFVLAELGVSLTAYIASASILGIAIAFGSQGIVQDVVSGLTIIFTNLFDIGDMVEVSGQTGLVKSVTMRFTVLQTALGADVFIPNRTVGNVTNYNRGYVRCLVDISLANNPEIAKNQQASAEKLMKAYVDQYPSIHRRTPDVDGVIATQSGRRFLRLKFRIWPGRGAILENQFRAEALAAMRATEPGYADWMVSISYEMEK
jgi:small conductance mechanosensitive channel